MSRAHVRTLALLSLIALLLSSWLPVALADGRTAPRQTEAVDQALAWLRAQQATDGSFPTAMGHPAGVTLDAALAGAAAGDSPAAWHGAGATSTLGAYLLGQGQAYATSPAATAKLLAGLVALGYDPVGLDGWDVSRHLITFRQADGAFGTPAAGSTLADQAWALLALAALRRPIDTEAIANLQGRQNADGGWGWAAKQASDPDSTALAIQALAGGDITANDKGVAAALAYLKAQQGPTGAIVSWGAPNGSSTAYALMALTALGQDALAESWRVQGKSLLDGLLALQLPEGAFAGFDGKPDVLTTAQAIPALAGRALPLRGPAPALRDALAYLVAGHSSAAGLDASLVPGTVMAVQAAGQDARAWKSASGATLLDLAAALAPKADTLGKAGALAVALAAAGADARQAAGVDLLAKITTALDAKTGAFDPDGNIWNHAYALWALAATKSIVPPAAVEWLLTQQNPDGGWGWAAGALSDSNSTALSVLALTACGQPASDKRLLKTAAYLRSMQMPDGGFRYDRSPDYTEGDGNSTALAMQALTALDPIFATDWRYAKPGVNGVVLQRPLDRLYALQLASGAFEWLPGKGANDLATVQIIPVLAARLAKPLAAPSTPAKAAAVAPTTGQTTTVAIDLGAWGPSLSAWARGRSLSGVALPPASAQEPITTGLAAFVVQMSPEQWLTRVAPLDANRPTAADALARAGLPIAWNEGFVCGIAGAGCPADNCFCSKDQFWGYSHWDGAAWQMAQSGPAGYEPKDRAVEGWRWGAGDPPVAPDAKALFNVNRLSPGVPRLTWSGGQVIARVDYQGDADGDGAVMARVQGADQAVPLQRLGAFGLWFGSLGQGLVSGEHTVCLEYADPDGVNASASWCSAVKVP